MRNGCLPIPCATFNMKAVSRANPFRKLRRLLVRLLVLSARPLPDDRDAIWSIPRVFQIVYFVFFIGICVPMIVGIVQDSMAAHPGAGWVLLARVTALEFAPIGVGAAIGNLIAVQGMTIIMLLYQQIARHFIPEAGEIQADSDQSEAEQQWARPPTDDDGQDLPIAEQTPDRQQSEEES